MSWTGELDDIRKELYDEIHNKGIPDADVTFIPYTKIQDVWAGDRLDRFLRDPHCDPDHGTDQAISDSQIEEARRGLLRMISLLIGIYWSEWSRFKKIFFLHPKATLERRDDNIENLKYNDLKHDSFLGDTPFLDQFLQNRWTYIPIILNGDKIDPYKLGTRLPLVRQDSLLREGGFGEVTKEMILPNHIVLRHSSDHLGLSDQTNSTELMVARKRFRNGRSDVELQQLKFIQSSLSSHKRIVYPLATLTIGTDLNIIMPWADMDLEDYLLGGYRSMNPDVHLLRDLIKESGELAAALEFLHHGLQAECYWPELPHQAICHADFKPRNILVFKQNKSSTGIWGITDFGVSQKSIRSLSREGFRSGLSTTRNSFPPPWGGIYKAPDLHAQRRSDIWSFGCILVRIFALGLGHGHQSKPDTSKDRLLDWQDIEHPFYEGSPPALNQNVKSWIQNLPDRYRQWYNVKFLTEMRDLLFSMLEIDFHKRLPAPDVRRCLHRLYHMAIERGPESADSSPIIPSPTTPTPPRTSSTSTTRTPDQPLDRLEVGVLVNNIRSGSVDDVKQCLRHRPEVEEGYEGDRPLIHAIKRGNASMVSALWEHKPDLDVRTRSSERETPLNLAVSKGDVGMVKILIDALIRNNSEDALNELSKAGKTPLMEAASHGHVAVVSELLNRGADTTICVGQDQQNCLHYAVGNIGSKEDLIKQFVGKMDFNQSPDGTEGYETPMMRHISLGVNERYGTPKVNSLWKKKFKVLLDGGGDVNRTYPQISPLQLAIAKDKVDIAEVLLEAGADLRGENGTTSKMRKTIKTMKEKKEKVGTSATGR